MCYRQLSAADEVGGQVTRCAVHLDCTAIGSAAHATALSHCKGVVAHEARIIERIDGGEKRAVALPRLAQIGWGDPVAEIALVA